MVDPNPQQTSAHNRRRTRHDVDPLTLISGTVSLAIATYVLFWYTASLSWLLALSAITVGTVLLALSVRRQQE